MLKWLLIPGSAPSKRVMDDPFRNYFALGLLIFVVIVNLYGIITILRKLISWSAARLRIEQG